MVCEEVLRELGLLSLGRRMVRERPYDCQQLYLRGEYREDGVRLLEVYSDRTRGNGHKLQHGRSRLGTRRKENSLSEWSNAGTDFPEFAEPQSLGYSKLDRTRS